MVLVLALIGIFFMVLVKRLSSDCLSQSSIAKQRALGLHLSRCQHLPFFCLSGALECLEREMCFRGARAPHACMCVAEIYLVYHDT